MTPLSRQLPLPFRAPLAAAPRVMPRAAVPERAFAGPLRAVRSASQGTAGVARAVASLEVSA